MRILEAKSWLDGHPQFQTESQWAYVMRMLTGYGAAVERAAEAAAIERCAKLVEGEPLDLFGMPKEMRITARAHVADGIRSLLLLK